MRKFAVLPSVLLATWLALSGTACIMVVDPDEFGQDPGLSREFNRTLDFKAGSDLAVENDHGSITISGGTDNSLEINSKWRLRKPSKTDIGIYGLWDDKPDVKIDRSANLVRIKAGWPEWPGTPMEVDCRIKTPASVNLTDIRLEDGDIEIADLYGKAGLHLGRGQVSVSNYSGSLEVDVDEGSVTAEVLDLREDDVIGITVDTGDIELRLEASAGGVVEAEAPAGTVTSDFDLGTGATGPVSSVKGKFGSGGTRIVLRTTRGNIRIVRTEDNGV